MFKRLMERVDRALGRGVVDDEMYEELNAALLQADTHVLVADSILGSLRQAVRTERITTPEGIRKRLGTEIAQRLGPPEGTRLTSPPSMPALYLFVGVNGAGKTTTIGKLAARLKRAGHSPLLAAGDTFRAGAIEQLEMWASRTGADFVGGQPGADPASVIFAAIEAAKARGRSHVLADTAGRQHTKGNLMAELTKVVRVAERALGRPPDETLLVVDGNTGQNALRQAEEFLKAATVTGIVVTKLDGTAKGGAMLGVWERYGAPIKLVGLGEGVEDLEDFVPESFARRFLA